ncbi:hypothetical protein Pan241w_11570 [Gimesia alba]|uniref:Holin n=1 Tax=Gimesia alba TaxID=2527973 RepID=A0A517RB45_9PLAN|nr:hypothetical protein [Gimesia alba]QDT41098.1 hypothetical protein Pan241w_11570 [Gimesia alba]
MQTFKSWLPIIAAIVGFFLIGNGGFTLSDALNMDTSNLSVLIQGIVSLLGGLGFSGAGMYFKGAGTDPSTYDQDVKSIKHLASTCKGCDEAEEALEVIHNRILKRLYGDDT